MRLLQNLPRSVRTTSSPSQKAGHACITRPYKTADHVHVHVHVNVDVDVDVRVLVVGCLRLDGLDSPSARVTARLSRGITLILSGVRWSIPGLPVALLTLAWNPGAWGQSKESSKV